MTDLEAAVSALTDPVLIPHMQKTDDGEYLRMHITELPCLLDQLESAIISSIGGQGNVQTGKNARNVVNGDALHQFTLISSTISSWCTSIAKIRAPRGARAGLLAFLSVKPDAGEFYINEMRRWASIITMTLDPPKTVQVIDPCPECGATDYTGDEGVIPHPVSVRYEREDPLSTVRANCAACDYEWSGLTAIRALRFQLDISLTDELT